MAADSPGEAGTVSTVQPPPVSAGVTAAGSVPRLFPLCSLLRNQHQGLLFVLFMFLCAAMTTVTDKRWSKTLSRGTSIWSINSVMITEKKYKLIHKSFASIQFLHEKGMFKTLELDCFCTCIYDSCE